MAIVKQLGYKHMISDHFTNNIRSHKVSQKYSAVVGVIPRAAYLIGSGWQGQAITYCDLNNVQLTFEQLMADNQRHHIDSNKLTAKI